MGVYIKNMSLMAFKTIMELGLKVDDDLLIEVKTPHGRLIDADKLTDKSFKSDVFLSDLILETEVYLAPTIIEAED